MWAGAQPVWLGAGLTSKPQARNVASRKARKRAARAYEPLLVSPAGTIHMQVRRWDADLYLMNAFLYFACAANELQEGADGGMEPFSASA